jgi:hypothetical protein
VKAFQRDGRWRQLPEKCSQLRGDLVNIRLRHPNLDPDRQVIIQGCITLLTQLEHRIDRSIEGGAAPKGFVDMNKRISSSLDELRVVLYDLETQERDR